MAIAFGNGPGTLSYQALRLSGQLRPGATPDADLINDVLFEANAMIDEWNAQELLQYFIDDRYFAISTSQQSYTLGPTGNFNTDIHNVALTYRPQRIVRANLILVSNGGSNTRIPIEIIDVESWADIPVINVASQVTIRMYVQTTKDNVTLWMFPFPTVGNQIEFFMWPGQPQFATLTTTFDAPPAWENYLIYSLAERLCALNTKDLQKTSGPGINRLQYLHSKVIDIRNTLWGSNAPTPRLAPDIQVNNPSTQGAPFDYLYGDYSQ